MKTTRIMLSMLLAVVTCSSLAQGVIIYKSNGTQEKLPYLAVDSIMPYYADKEPVKIEPKAVDLGLPSGTLWASQNVGATAPEEFGGYYALGETEEKLTYSWSTYMCTQNECGSSADPFYADGLLTYTKVSTVVLNVKCNIAGTKHDVATQKWGDSWVMPTADQFQELFDYCTRECVKINDVDCVEYTGPNGNTLIIPLSSGYKEEKSLKDADSYNKATYFWTADFNFALDSGGSATVTSTSEWAGSNQFQNYRYRGKLVRPVLKEGAEIPGSGNSGGETESDFAKEVYGKYWFVYYDGSSENAEWVYLESELTAEGLTIYYPASYYLILAYTIPVEIDDANKQVKAGPNGSFIGMYGARAYTYLAWYNYDAYVSGFGDSAVTIGTLSTEEDEEDGKMYTYLDWAGTFAGNTIDAWVLQVFTAPEYKEGENYVGVLDYLVSPYMIKIDEAEEAATARGTTRQTGVINSRGHKIYPAKPNSKGVLK